jgi:hypothetical protein
MSENHGGGGHHAAEHWHSCKHGSELAKLQPPHRNQPLSAYHVIHQCSQCELVIVHMATAVDCASPSPVMAMVIQGPESRRIRLKDDQHQQRVSATSV